MSYKPAGYTSVAPYLVVEGAAATLTFLEKTFDGERLRLISGNDGIVRHGEIRIGDTVVMLADAVPGWPAIAAHVHIYVPDVDRTYAKALAAGAVAVQSPVQKEDADKRGGFRDAGGTTWWVATQIVKG